MTQGHKNQPKLSPFVCLAIGVLLLLVCLFASLAYEAKDILLPTILTSFTTFDDSIDHLIVLSMRLPRSLIAIMVGASLAFSGGLMQRLTRNLLSLIVSPISPLAPRPRQHLMVRFYDWQVYLKYLKGNLADKQADAKK